MKGSAGSEEEAIKIRVSKPSGDGVTNIRGIYVEKIGPEKGMLGDKRSEEFCIPTCFPFLAILSISHQIRVCQPFRCRDPQNG